MLRKLFCLSLWMVIYSSLSTAWGLPSHAGALLSHGTEEELTAISTQLSPPTTVSCKKTTPTLSPSSLRPGKWAKVALPLALMASVYPTAAAGPICATAVAGACGILGMTCIAAGVWNGGLLSIPCITQVSPMCSTAIMGCVAVPGPI
ncbi:MAG: hypothetical protein OXT67_11765 [Zetaproteobacteria bacterium]|nr:hypothetical protein [Zetaproteobacteria bacterium]